MKVHDPNLRGAGLNPADLSKSQPAHADRARSKSGAPPAGDAHDGMQLSGLAAQLSAAAAESPEREARVESLARTHAQGHYAVDPNGLAARIIDDAIRSQ